MFKVNFILLISCLSSFGQVGFGSFNQLPLLGDNQSLVISNLNDAVIYVDPNQGPAVTNWSGAIAGDNEAVQVWPDLTTNHFNLIQMRGANSGITNHTTLGPNGKRFIGFGSFTNNDTCLTGLTNGTSKIIYAQPNTFFFVLRDPDPISVTPGGCILNGLTNNFEQWNWSTGGEDIYAGTDKVFIDNSQSWSTNWPKVTWKIVTIQFNGTNSITRLNGAPWPPGGTNWNLGSNPASGVTLGSYQNFAQGSRMQLASFLWVNGSRWTDTNLLLQIERNMGTEFGIATP